MFEGLKLYLKYHKGVPGFRRNKKGAIEFDELGKLIIGIVFIIVLLTIVGIIIKDRLFDQGDRVKEGFTLIK